MVIGFVYVATNRSMPGLVKIGYTCNAPSARIASLSASTGVPTEFELYCAFECENPSEFEAALHEEFKAHRCSQNREFFKVNPLAVYEKVTNEFGSHLHEMASVQLACDLSKKRQEKCQIE